jgi:hypothetical protein
MMQGGSEADEIRFYGESKLILEGLLPINDVWKDKYIEATLMLLLINEMNPDNKKKIKANFNKLSEHLRSFTTYSDIDHNCTFAKLTSIMTNSSASGRSVAAFAHEDKANYLPGMSVKGIIDLKNKLRSINQQLSLYDSSQRRDKLDIYRYLGKLDKVQYNYENLPNLGDQNKFFDDLFNDIETVFNHINRHETDASKKQILNKAIVALKTIKDANDHTLDKQKEIMNRMLGMSGMVKGGASTGTVDEGLVESFASNVESFNRYQQKFVEAMPKILDEFDKLM